MKLEKQVVSLELAKKLKELGFEQESLFDWVEIDDNDWLLMGRVKNLFDKQDEETKNSVISAFTVSELGEMLPIINNFSPVTSKLDKSFQCGYLDNDGGETITKFEIQEADTEANVRAKMIIYLKENNLI